MFLAVVALVALFTSVRASGTLLKTGNVVVSVHDTGLYDIIVDGTPWVTGGSEALPVFPGETLSLDGPPTYVSGSDTMGAFQGVEFAWGRNTRVVTTIKAYTSTAEGYPSEVAVFTQTFPDGYSTPKEPSSVCARVHDNQDQTGGNVVKELKNQTDTSCCAACNAYDPPICNAWVRQPSTGDCWLIRSPTGTEPKSDRTLGYGVDPQTVSEPILPFPTFSTSLVGAELMSMKFGGCQDDQSYVTTWHNTSFASETDGIPLVLFSASARTLAMTPDDSFLVAVASNSHSASGTVSYNVGVKQSVESIPSGFSFSSVLVGGHGVNDTMVSMGDVLLGKSGKRRPDPYADFMLSHLTYWTDNGAYFYHATNGFNNHEDALKAMKAEFEKEKLPFRAVQLDDWWAVGDGDIPGITWWWPTQSSIPDGLTNWLNMPTSLYAPMYARDNVYIESDAYPWEWAVSERSAIPLEQGFYDALFVNGSVAQMVMFEQDFFCTHNQDTNLTNSNVDTGKRWLSAMNAAALKANITLQWCMMNPVHTLMSSAYQAVTNGRATDDNTRGWARNVLVLPYSSMLHYSVGMWPSRDNVFTSSLESNCANYNCSEPNAELQNTMAVLSGGPYGPSDGPGFLNSSRIMRSCRSDGVLLRASKPLTPLDSSLTAAFSTGGTSVDVFATFSQVGPLRFSHVLGLALNASHTVTLRDLDPASTTSSYAVYPAASPASVVRMAADGALKLDAMAPFTDVIPYAHYVVSPVLNGGWVILGEDKFVPVSSRRFSTVSASASTVSFQVRCASTEEVVARVMDADGTAMEATCTARACTGVDCDVVMTAVCTSGGGCKCQ